jgi:hypothetical protein
MRVAVVALRTYAPLHVGSERWKRVTKDGWRLIPGWTLYGAVAHALMKLTCTERHAGGITCERCIAEPHTACGYARLLTRTMRESKERIRFSPLVVSSFRGDGSRYDALAYSHDAVSCQPATTVLPRAPLDRQSGAVFGERLHGAHAHAPFQEYRGFIYVDAGFVETLQKALQCLSLFPFGGARGKFCQVEAGVEHLCSPHDFLPRKVRLRVPLITPAIMSPERLRKMDLESISSFAMKRYRTWRTGFYREGGRPVAFGVRDTEPSGVSEAIESEREDSALPVRPHVTAGALGLAEGCVLQFRPGSEDTIKRLFLRGLGSGDHAYLGWGQLCFDGGQDGN